MVQEFKDIYDIHPWLRYITWTGLLSMALFLFWAGGFPPQVWGLLPQVIQQVPHAWVIRGPATLFPLATITVISLAWLIAWCLLLWACLGLVWHHHKLARHILWKKFKLQQGSMEWNPSETFADNYSARTVHDQSQMCMESSFDIPLPGLHLPQQPPQQVRHAPHPFLVSSQLVAVQDKAYGRDTSGSYGSVATMTRPRPAQQLVVGTGWDTGIKRKHKPNEDSLVALQSICTCNGRLIPFGLFVVADGMGGHAYGQQASQIAIHSMIQSVLPNLMKSNSLSNASLIKMLLDSVEQANQAICHYIREQVEGVDMGTTLTAALSVDAKAYIVNVGDSRTYLYREGKGLSQITRDHSLVARLVASGAIAPDEVYTHPGRNKVYRFVGDSKGVEVDWFVVDLWKGDRLLLCSDGLWEMVRDPEIERIIESRTDAMQVSERLVQAALNGGGADNVSVIVVQV